MNTFVESQPNHGNKHVRDVKSLRRGDMIKIIFGTRSTEEVIFLWKDEKKIYYSSIRDYRQWMVSQIDHIPVEYKFRSDVGLDRYTGVIEGLGWNNRNYVVKTGNTAARDVLKNINKHGQCFSIF